MKIFKVQMPDDSMLSSTDFDYVDSFQGQYVDNNDKVSITDIGKALFNSAPKWTSLLFEIRNKIVSIFGLKTPGKNRSRQELLENFNCEPGERLGLFKVFAKTENEVILGEDDKHLNFRISLLKEIIVHEAGTKKLTVSTTVKYNNWFGKLYFLPVKPFHKLIVPTMLKGVIRQIEKGEMTT